MEIYRANTVAEIQSFYGSLLFPKEGISIYDHLDDIALKLYDGLKKREPILYTEMNNYHPQFLGVDKKILANRDFSLEDCRYTIANEYGFKSWAEVGMLKDSYYNMAFEKCINALLSGKKSELFRLLTKNPSLAKGKSNYGHEATLLHYCGSNGIELWRQQVPYNLAEMIEILIDFGADRNSQMKVYGGYHTAYSLFMSSAHPYDAGIEIETIATFLK